MINLEQNLEKYADLVIKKGINLQPNQVVVIKAPILAADLVRKINKKAYEAGAKYVEVMWRDEQITLDRFMHASEESFDEYPKWLTDMHSEFCKQGVALINVIAEDPDLLKDVDSKRISQSMKAASIGLEEFKHYTMNDKLCWNIVTYPNENWAVKIFPELNKSEAVEKLWEQIFDITRVNTEDPIAAWDKHIANLKVKTAYLNEKKFTKLHYKAPGTDLVIDLPEEHIWIGGGSESVNGVYFLPNIPTEEVFTAPKKSGVNGVVANTKPLSYGGNLIDGFTLTFKDGKVVDFTAEKGYDVLKGLLDTDEGARHLGEVALVPQDSPISNSNLIFYNTLYDENASNHLAIGAAYSPCVEGGKEMSKAELEANDINSSLTHVDFMIGSEKMDIDAYTADGQMFPLFRNGNWAI